MPLKLNLLELATLLIALMLVGAYLHWLYRDWRHSVLLTLALVPPLLLSVERVSTFLTIDENYISSEIIYWGDQPLEDIAKDYLHGTGRTTSPIFGMVTWAIQKVAPNSIDLITIVQKLLHWLLCIPILLGTHAVLHRYFLREGARPYGALLFFYAALLTPLNMLAIKTFTFDAFSLLLGILGLLLCYAAWIDVSPKLALAALVVTFLSAQEKYFAAPLLLLAIALYASSQVRAHTGKAVLLRIIIHTLVAFAICLAISLLGAVIMGYLRGWREFGLLLKTVPQPLISWTLPFVLNSTLSFSEMLDQVMPAITLPALALTAGGCVVVAVILHWLRVHPIGLRLLRVAQRVLPAFSLIALLFIAVIGLIGIFAVNAYAATPSSPFLPGQYDQVAYVSGVYRHYGMQTWLGHILSHTAFTSGLLMVALPTVFWLIGAATLILNRRQMRETSSAAALMAHLMILLGCVFPLLYGVLSSPYAMPPSARYFNLGVLAMLIGWLILASRVFDARSTAVKRAITAAFCLLLIAEMLPFRPLYAAFRPLWLNLPQSNEDVEVGIIDPLWSGWGEEAMIVGSWLQDRCKAGGDAPAAPSDNPAEQTCSQIRVWSLYPGVWLELDKVIQTPIPWHDPFTYTAYDYYVFNRTTITTDRVKEPQGVEPIYVVQYRGYIQAWVYQGDDLQRAGYDFEGTD